MNSTPMPVFPARKSNSGKLWTRLIFIPVVIVGASIIALLRLLTDINELFSVSPSVLSRNAAYASHRKLSLKKSPTGEDIYPSVLTIVMTSPSFHESRVANIRKTWASSSYEREDLDVLFVTANVTDGNSDMIASNCTVGQRDYSCCLMLAALKEGYKRLVVEKKFDWLMVVSDEHYLLQDNFQRLLATTPAPENGYFMRGVQTCGNPGCFGLCGGGGSAYPMNTLKYLVEGFDGSRFKSFDEEVMTSCTDKCEYWPFNAVSHVFLNQRKEIQVLGMPGSHCNGIEPSMLHMNLLTDTPKPILINYASGYMQQLHKLVEIYHSNEEFEEIPAQSA